MNYKWQSKKLKSQCHAERVEPFSTANGEPLFNLKSLHPDTSRAQGLGKTEEKAKRDFEEQVAKLYPEEIIR